MILLIEFGSQFRNIIFYGVIALDSVIEHSAESSCDAPMGTDFLGNYYTLMNEFWVVGTPDDTVDRVRKQVPKYYFLRSYCP